MLKQALTLWKQERNKKGTSLQRRLIAFFASALAFVILSFTALLLVLDITGSGRNTVYNYVQSELSRVKTEVNNDLGRLSIKGVAMAESIASLSEDFFDENKITADELAAHPELIENLLAKQMPALLNVMDNNTCGGVFVLLDATVSPDAQDAEFRKAGIFLKKTLPRQMQSVGAKSHYLRGPAEIARDNGIELLGQWKMEYDTSGLSCFAAAMENARQNPGVALSRLYYWTERVILKGNSNAGFLLCVPLRTSDGTVFGLCGIEVSDRMLKQLYSPGDNSYNNVFTLISPEGKSALRADAGMIAGNYYLTGYRMEESLAVCNSRKGFNSYVSQSAVYGGLNATLHLYPDGSVYSDDWSVAIMMPMDQLNKAITGKTPYLLIAVLFLLLLSLGASFIISRRCLRPVTDALNTIKTKNYTAANNRYLEINDLMEFLAKQDEDNKNKRASEEPASVTPIFDEFLKNIETLSNAERSVFDLYIKGYNAQEIAETLFLSINTIKTHNRRIFSKLNVSSRKELLVYIDMMKEMNLINKE